MLLYVQTNINMKFCNMNGILYDKWNKKLDYLHNLNKKKHRNKQVLNVCKNHDKIYKL